jgi:hypothetical protein
MSRFRSADDPEPLVLSERVVAELLTPAAVHFGPFLPSI